MKTALCLCLGLLSGPWTDPAPAQQPPRQLLEGVGIDQRLDAQVPGDLALRDETGQTVHLGDYFGSKPIVLVLVYFRCPKLCPMVLENLTSGLRGIPDMNVGEQFSVVTVSFDPHDTPAEAMKKKQTYVESYGRPGAAEGWHFLTGDQPDIDRLTETVGFHYKYDAKNDMYIHASGIMILTPEGKIARYLLGAQYRPRDLRLGLVEASQNKIGTPVDQVLLYCFHYDPTVGKYTANVMGLLQLAGIVTLVCIGAFFLGLRRYRRRQAAQQAAAPS
jgi:protein SCO1/2